MSKQFTARQGDVLIIAVSRIPKNAKPIPRENGRLVLAHGEASGHAHVVDSPDALFLAADLGEMADRFLKVDESAARDIMVPVFEDRPTGRFVTPEPYYDEDERALVTPDPVEETERVQVGVRVERGVQVVHDEHASITLPPGSYAVRRQREYAPEGIQQVGD